MADMSVSPRNQSQQLRDVNDEFESRKQDLKSDHESKLRQIQKAYSKSEQAIRDNGEAAISHIRKDSQKRVETEAGQLQENADQVIARVDSESKQKVKTTQENGIKTAEGLQKQYSKEINNTQRKGETDLQATKEKYDQELHNDENFYKDQMDSEKKQFVEGQAKLQTEYDKKRKETTDIQRKNITELTKKYNEQFVKNESMNQDSFTLQKQNFLKELYKQQQSLAHQSEVFESKMDDPFYQARDVHARIFESDGAYVIKAKVPEPEKNNFSVHVKDGKAVVESFRSSEAKIDNEGEKSSTNAYQTFRQEFKLSYPVAHNLITKQIDGDGNLTVTIPKKDLSAKA